MSGQYSCSIFADALNHFVKHSFANMCIECCNRIIHQDNVRFFVNSSGKADSCFLSFTEIDASISYLRLVTSWQYLQIPLKLARFNNFFVKGLFKFLSKYYVALNCLILNPGLLLHITQSSKLNNWCIFNFVSAYAIRKFVESFLCPSLICPSFLKI